MPNKVDKGLSKKRMTGQMTFQVLRRSDQNAGRQGADTVYDSPTEACEWNDDENRWEITLIGLNELEEFAGEVEAPLRVFFPTVSEDADGELPILEILDEE
jgi:hypothetical protein